MSDESEIPTRLNQIPTEWGLILEAHEPSSPCVIEARNAMVMRYATAIRRYVGAILQNDDEADDLAQDVIVRLLQGDFGGADPLRGRFRDLLGTALRNMTSSHFTKKKRRRPVEHDLTQVATPNTDDPVWVEAWREHLLSMAWSKLEHSERKNAGSVVHAVLRLRTDQPDADMEQLAEQLSQKIGRSMNAAAFRQQLRRSRIQFAEYLTREVMAGLKDASPERLWDELIALGLYEQVRDFMRSGS